MFSSAAPNDYTALNDALVVYQPGDLPMTMQCVDVSIIDEDIVENDEDFGISLLSNDPGVSIVPASQQATATIINDDGKKTQ